MRCSISRSGRRSTRSSATRRSTAHSIFVPYCVYWFRKAAERLAPGQRAGLVGTNSIAQNRARSASLDYVVDRGGVITNAVSSQKWPGEAKVHVSLVNWVQQPTPPPVEFTLDGAPVDGITAELRDVRASTSSAAPLAGNRGRAFQGPIPAGKGFVLADGIAKAILARSEAEYSDVVRPFLDSEDIAETVDQAPTRSIIDFASMTLEEAMRYPAALEIVEATVRPVRKDARRKAHRERWWLFAEPRKGLRVAVSALPRHLAVAGAMESALSSLGSSHAGWRVTQRWCSRSTTTTRSGS